MGNDNDSSYNNRRSASNVYKLCGDITSYFLLFLVIAAIIDFSVIAITNDDDGVQKSMGEEEKMWNMIYLVSIAISSKAL